MVDFISTFCTIIPIVIVSVLLALTWSSLKFNGGCRVWFRHLERSSAKSRKIRRRFKVESVENKLCKAETLVLPVSSCLEDINSNSTFTRRSFLQMQPIQVQSFLF